MDEEKNSVKIHFEGWTHRYDEVNHLTFTIEIYHNSMILVDEKEFSEISTFQKTY